MVQGSMYIEFNLLSKSIRVYIAYKTHTLNESYVFKSKRHSI